MDLDKIRKDFPALTQIVNNNKLIYFDNAATTLKPTAVINAVSEYFSTINSNVHRVGHYLSSKATKEYERSRANVADFVNAKDSSEIIFTKGTTESINLLADVLSKDQLKDGDEIILTRMEHHSNIVPWVALKDKIDLTIKVVDFDSEGNLDLENLDSMFSEKTKIISLAHSSNVLGTINPIEKIVAKAKSRGVITIIDGAQAIVHEKVDVQKIDCDFYVFSGHKLYAPMGIGVIYGKKKLLEKMSPYQKGGGMIEIVSFDTVKYNDSPYRFEAGTPNVNGAIGLSKAIDYIRGIGQNSIKQREQSLLNYAYEKLKNIEGISFYGTCIDKDPIISFNIDGIHHSDLSMILDKFGIATRSGSHCAQPLFNHYGISGSIRISFAFYNINEEIDIFVDKLDLAIKMLK